MYTLFNSDSNPDKVTVTIPKFTSVKKIVNSDIQKLMDYYKDYIYRLDNTHLLIRILSILNVSFQRNMLDYVETAREKVPFLARSLKLIYPTNDKAEPHVGVFYNEHVIEYIIASDDYFDIEEASKHWGYINAVKIHTHPFTDFSLGCANGKYISNSEKGCAVISINIPMLAFQWRMWCRKFKYKADFYTRANHFITQFVLINTLRRHTEHTLINRFMGYYLQKPLAPYIKQHPIYIPDYTSRVDESISEMIKVVESKKLTMQEIFTMFPNFNHPSWSYVINLPDLATTRFTKWVYLISYLPYIEMYLALAKNKDIRLDTETLQYIKRNISYLENSRGLLIPLDNTSSQRLMNVKGMLVDYRA